MLQGRECDAEVGAEEAPEAFEDRPTGFVVPNEPLNEHSLEELKKHKFPELEDTPSASVPALIKFSDKRLLDFTKLEAKVAASSISTKDKLHRCAEAVQLCALRCYLFASTYDTLTHATCRPLLKLTASAKYTPNAL